MRKKSDEETVLLANGCQDCGLAYDGDLGWIEAIVPDEVWKIITPNPKEYDNWRGGLLCVTCISRRCAEAGLLNVPVLLCGTEPLTAVMDCEGLKTYQPLCDDCMQSFKDHGLHRPFCVECGRDSRYENSVGFEPDASILAVGYVVERKHEHSTNNVGKPVYAWDYCQDGRPLGEMHIE